MSDYDGYDAIPEEYDPPVDLTDETTPPLDDQPEWGGDEPYTNSDSPHPMKKKFRQAVGGLAGTVIKVGGMLAGSSGELVEAQGELAEQMTEDAIDRIDGEG